MTARPPTGPRLRPAPGVISRDTDGGVIILDADSGACYEGNRTAAVVWSALVDGADLASVCGSLSAEYDVPAERVERDVATLLDALTERGLLEPTS